MVVLVQRKNLILGAGTLLFLMLLAPLVHAAAYSVVIEPEDDSVLRNESAVYTVLLSNFEEYPVTFQGYTIDPTWTVKTDPLDVEVPAGGKRNITLYLRPTSATRFGPQGVNVNFRAFETGDVLRNTVIVSLLSGNERNREYVPTVAMDILMPYDIDPRNPIPLRLELRNSNQLNISNLTILISSPHFSTSGVVNLAPLSEKTRDFEGIAIPRTTSPAEAEVTVQLVYNGEVVRQQVKNYRIKEYTQVAQRVREKSMFFKTEKTVEVENEGNVKNTAIVSVPTSFIKTLFISSNLTYETEVRDGQRVVYWSVPLDPYSPQSFTYTENYRILVLLFLLGILSAIGYLLLRSPVVAVKEAVAIAHAEGVSDIKVRVFVKNRSAKIIQGIQVTDRVPSLAEVIKHETPGSIPPSKMAVNEKQGTLLRWDLDVLEPFEERVLTYRVKSKLKIIGRMKLPNARIRYTVNNKERAVYSNNIELVEKFRDA